jgi:hypothetical protein
MAGLSDYAEKLALDYMMTAGAVTRPTTWYVALYTSAASDSAAGTEVSTGGYTRKSVSFNATTLGVGTTANSMIVSWTAAGASLGTVTHIGILDASTAGNLLWTGALSVPKTVADGDTIQFATGNLTLTLD